MKQLVLVRHGATAATERRAFGADEPITEAARERAASLASVLPTNAHVFSSPKLRCRQTAHAAGLRAGLDPDLTECRFGAWEGQTFAEIEAADPELVGAWLTDPSVAPPGGESLVAFTKRIAALLGRLANLAADAIVTITHAGVIKAAVVHALGAPLDALWRIEVAPLTLTDLRLHDGRWSLHGLNGQPA